MKQIIKTGVALFLVQYLVVAGVVVGIGTRTPPETSPVPSAPTASMSPRPTKKPIRATLTPPPEHPAQAAIPASEPTVAPTPVPVVDAGCIITVHGSRYNVTGFRTQHSGGDIFTCGADMTAVFDSQHSMSTLQRMAPLAVN